MLLVREHTCCFLYQLLNPAHVHSWASTLTSHHVRPSPSPHPGATLSSPSLLAGILSDLAEIGSFFRPPYVAASILSGLAEIGGFFRPPRLNGHCMSFVITIHVVNILNDQTI
jgi:hypothetical protein